MLSNDIFEDLISSINAPILVLDHNLKIIMFNKSFLTTFKIDYRINKDILIFDFNNKQWDIPELRNLLEDILPQKKSIENFKITYNFKNLGIKGLIFNVKKIQIEADKPEYIILNIDEFKEAKKDQEKSIIKLDYVNKQILSELYKNGKTSLQQLSKKIYKLNSKQMSNTGIKNRLKKLIDNEILHIQGNVNVEKLNYNITFYLIELKEYESIKKFNHLMSNCPRIFLLAYTTGRYQLILGLVGENIKDINDCINTCELIDKNNIDIKNSEILFVSKLQIPKYLSLNLFSKFDNKSKCKKLDRASEGF